MKFKEDDQKIYVIEYDRVDDVHICQSEDGTHHRISLELCGAYSEHDSEWYVGKAFTCRAVPYHSFATELKHIGDWK